MTMHLTTYAIIVSIVVMLTGAVVFFVAPREHGTQYHVGATIFWLAAAATLVSGITTGVAAGGSTSCERKADDMNRDWKYGLLAGCRVQSDDGRFVPLENLRIFSQEREGR